MNEGKLKVLRSIYYDAGRSGSFGGVRQLYRRAHDADNTITFSDTKKWLSGQDAYTLHRDQRKRFKRNKYQISGIDDLWQADLADMTSIADDNDRYKYILVVIDCFSRFLWVQPIKSKNTRDVTAAMSKVMIEAAPRTPRNFQVDKGGEFRGKQFIQLLQDKGVNHYTTNNPDTKAAFAERVIRTLKGRIFRYLTHNTTRRYVDVLQSIADAYNHTKHRSIGTAPALVTSNNEQNIKERLYPGGVGNQEVGDKVRLAQERYVFYKGYRQKWTDEIFTVTHCIKRHPPVYRVTDAADEPIVGTFYAEELQFVTKDDDVYKVERILGQRRRNGKKQYLIKWLGYPESMSTWEPEENIQQD